MTGEKSLSEAARSEIDEATRRNVVMIPVIAVWELGMLSARGRIEFKPSVRDWVFNSLTLPGVRLAQLTPDVALLCSQLPGYIHADPADRMIVATAIELDATLVTRDKALLAYGAQGHVKALEA